MAASRAEEHESSKTKFDDRLCEIEISCVTGFEKVVQADIEEKLNVKVIPKQGKVFTFIAFKHVRKLLDLSSVDNLYVVLKHYNDFIFADNKDAAMEQFMGIVPDLDWEFGLKVWERFIGFKLPVSPLPQPSFTTSATLPISPGGARPSQSDDPANDREKDTGECKKASSEEAQESEPTSVSDTEVRGHGDHTVSSTTETAPSDAADVVSPPPTIAVPVDSAGEGHPVNGLSAPAAKKVILEGPDEEDQAVGGGGDAPSAAGPTVVGPAPPVSKPCPNPDMPAFRATCYRAGTTHSFQSPNVARHFGGAVQDYFGWNVRMKNYDIEVVVNVDEKSIYVTLALTKESLHRRHIVEFGQCTLRPTIAYGMLRLCDIQDGEVVCDPMCGTGSIPIEAAVNWPGAVHACGDVQNSCIQKTAANMAAVNETRARLNKPPISLEITKWDATELPFPDGHVDVFISDMPFGKRSGSKTNNASLYPQLMKEWARTSKPGKARACLLTQDRTSIQKTMAKVGRLWQHKSTTFINIGGIIAGVFLFGRTLCTDYKLTNT